MAEKENEAAACYSGKLTCDESSVDSAVSEVADSSCALVNSFTVTFKKSPKFYTIFCKSLFSVKIHGNK